jgi:DNA adenine methylase
VTLRAPFPWFGGKSRAAALVWRGFGDVANYVEPFAGSLAVLLGRPTAPRIETVNDLDCYVANFWRALKFAPDEVAQHADWPVNEADLHARHRWLVAQDEFRRRMKREPKFFDAQVAGWWVWGLCQWIGGGWCANSNWEGRTNAGRRSLGIFARSRGTGFDQARPNLHSANGVHRNLGERTAEQEKRPVLAHGTGRGVLRDLSQQLPMISGDSGASGRGVHASGATSGPLLEWMHALAERLRKVRVCCGDWKRVLGPSATEKIGVTGVLLDPPYAFDAGRDPSLYAVESATVAHDVRDWALANSNNPKLRIALCGYEGEHEMPPTWECVAWKAGGGYAASAGNTENAKRERIWFSPACEVVQRQGDLFKAGVQ